MRCLSIILFSSLACGSQAASEQRDSGYAAIDAGCVGPECHNGCPDGEQTTIRGVVTAPNGIDPIAGAYVFVPDGPLEPFPEETTCQLCSQLTNSALVVTRTNGRGEFELGPVPTVAQQAPGTTIRLVTQIGRFRKVADVPIASPCEDNAPAEELFRLPTRTNGLDAIPRIAVASGEYDVIECVLLNLGLAADAIDMYTNITNDDGVENGLGDLLDDPARLHSYDMLFVNCGNGAYDQVLDNPTTRANIEAFVRSGGRLYATDWAYGYIESIEQFAPIIDFAPGPSGPEPEPRSAAAIGIVDQDIDAEVLDDELAAWLEAVEERAGEELISDQERVRVGDFLGRWAMQYAVAESQGNKVWLRGWVEGEGLVGNLPLTTTFDYEGCGRALFSSYHTQYGNPDDGGFPGYCESPTLSPQERVLEYLIFHLNDCIVID